MANDDSGFSTFFEIQGFDKQGYGPTGSLTRRAWRQECFSNFVAGPVQFASWQGNLESQRDSIRPRVSYGLILNSDLGSEETLHDELTDELVLDFCGITIEKLAKWEQHEGSIFTFHFKTLFSFAHLKLATYFQGAKFHEDVSFRKVNFSGRLSFTDAIFLAAVDFSQCQFIGETDFTRSTFNGKSLFVSSQFKQKFVASQIISKSVLDFGSAVFFAEVDLSEGKLFRITFDKAQFCGGTSLDNCEFLSSFDFRHVNCKGEFSATGARFCAMATFDDVDFKSAVNFSSCTFLNGSTFIASSFGGATHFMHSQFFGSVSFSNTSFASLVNFSKAEFSSSTLFCNAKFSHEFTATDAIFTSSFSFLNVICKSAVSFSNAQFLGDSTFESAHFSRTSHFAQTHFAKAAIFKNALFAGSCNFESSDFLSVGHFEVANFKTEIPSFRGCAIDSTRLEFSSDDCFPLMVLTEDGIKNASFLKRLADENGQTDQALMFNAIELRAKRRRTDEPFFLRVVSWMYDVTSDYGRSVARPFCLYLALLVFTYLLAALNAYINMDGDSCKKLPGGAFTRLQAESIDCSVRQASLQDDKIVVSGFRAAFEYTAYRSTGIIDFSDTGKGTDAVARRLFGQPTEPWHMRIWGTFKATISLLLIFLTALGLRNKFRVK
jgi:Pentapeptide repeats (9 copies)